jgi:hypothetical protein
MEDNFVAFSDGVIDSKFQIGKCPAAQLDVVFDVLNSRVEVGEDRIVESDLVCEVLGGLVQVAMVPALFHESLDNLLVYIRRLVLLRHRLPSFPWAGIIDPGGSDTRRIPVIFLRILRRKAKQRDILR